MPLDDELVPTTTSASPKVVYKLNVSRRTGTSSQSRPSLFASAISPIQRRLSVDDAHGAESEEGEGCEKEESSGSKDSGRVSFVLPKRDDSPSRVPRSPKRPDFLASSEPSKSLSPTTKPRLSMSCPSIF